MSKDVKPAFYAIIPADVRYDKNLKANAKLLYGEITALCNERGYCWAGNEYFANLYGVSVKTITTWVSDLVNKGYLHRKLVYKGNTKEIEARILRLPSPYPLSINNGAPYPQNNGEGVNQGKPTEIDLQGKKGLPINNGAPIPQKTADNITYEYINEVFNKHFPNYNAFIPLVEKWLNYKKHEKKQVYKTEDSLKSWIKKLIKFSAGNFQKAEDLIDTAMANLWMGIQEPKNCSYKSSQKPITLNFTSDQPGQSKYGGF